ncbi:hypothetical protein P8C59_004937 [Phyllachora maydis]|uniref:Uncharacterized protein n=1 Tax=Phyllachora maydis TaxID=1825666 RepID=A0AAD9I555_9PEZI|nr:hypothetical protein P8C59_004937 [Phyllachora maydis]
MRTFSVMLAALASVTGVTSALSLPHESFPAARHPRAAIAGPAGGTRVGTGLSPQPKVVHNVAVREEDPDPADPEWYKMRILTWQARWVPWNMELKFTVNGQLCSTPFLYWDLISALRDEIAAALGRGNELVGLDYRWQPITIGGTMAPPLGFFRAVVKPGEGDLVEKLSIYPLPVPSDSDSDDSGASGSGNNDVDSDSDDDDDDDDDGDDVVVPDVDMNAANGADDNGDDAVMPDFDEAHVKRANAKRDKANLDNGGIVPGNNRYDDHGDNAIVPDDGGPDRNQSDGEESQGDEFNESDSDLNDSDDDEFSDGEPWLPWKTVLPGEAKWALLNQEIITFLDMDMGGAVFYQGYAYIELDGIHGAVALFFGSDAITVVNLDVAEGVHSLDYVQQAVLGSRTAVDNQCLDALWLLVPYAHEFGYVENLERPILAVVPDRRLWSNYFTWELFGQRDAGLDPIKGTWVLQLDPTRLWWQFEPPEASEELPGRSDSPQQRRGLVAVRDHQRGRRCTNKTADAPPPLQHVQDQIPFGRGPAPVDMAIRRATRTGRPQRFRDIPPAESKPRIA